VLPIHSEGLRTLAQNRRFDLALPQAQAAVRSNMRNVTHWIDLAAVYQAAGRINDAERTFDEAIRRFDHPFLFSLRAYVKHAARKYDSALDDLREAERRSPNDVNNLNNLAAALVDQGRYEESIRYLERVLAIDPKHDGALANLSTIYLKLGRFDEAVEIKERQLSIDPDNPEHYLWLLHQLRSAGRLSRFRELFDPERTKNAYARAQKFETFSALNYIDDPAWHLTLARQQALRVAHYEVLEGSKVPPRPDEAQPGARLRIGYWSCDFYDHATAQLISEVFELHDRNRFEIFILAYGQLHGDAAEMRIRNGAEHFVDLCPLSDQDAVNRIAGLDLDILVDLKGYTSSTRMAVPFARPARIVVSWLGYPGSLGTGKVDWIIGDEVVTPPGCEPFYDEKIVRLAGSYQPNDSKQPVAPALPRAAYGLPENAIVLAAFNAVHKITPEMFDIWMRVLKQNENLCLWLFAENASNFQQLRREAHQRGVDGRQIVHAGKMKRPEHIARYKVADLALDCFPYGSHTTGSDALRCGCPLLGLKGRSFASRVSASLLNAVSAVSAVDSSGLLSELITETPLDYEARLVELTNAPERLRALRQGLESAVRHSRLFDTHSFVRGLEEAYRRMLDGHHGRA
jgi:predicted O-linked N-acetylglucosamine transferase (SPINDLY family)